MKVGEKFISGEGSKFHVKTTYDIAPALDEAARLRSEGVGLTGEHRLVGAVPAWLVDQWVKDAGLKSDDNDARKEVIKKKLQSGEFSKLRVWNGTY